MSWREALLTKWGAGGLAGITLGRWLGVLRDNQFAVDWPYWGRAAVITLSSIPNSLFAASENLLYRQKIRKTKIDPPLFILGIWRSGTTLLHNLLAQDDRFAYPNTYQVSFPQTFLTTEKINAKFMGYFLPKKRPMDNVAFGFAEPQEDEFALWPLVGGFTMGWAFPGRAQFYNRYLTLRHVTENELAEWKAALTWFLQKLAFKYGKPLVLKSPGHTCRIKVLLELSRRQDSFIFAGILLMSSGPPNTGSESERRCGRSSGLTIATWRTASFDSTRRFTILFSRSEG